MNARELVSTLQLPKDVLLQEFHINMVGPGELWLENYKGILLITSSEIHIMGKRCIICIKGRELAIPWYSGVEMRVTGIILEIHFTPGNA